jgi:hypothetical protein
MKELVRIREGDSRLVSCVAVSVMSLDGKYVKGAHATRRVAPRPRRPERQRGIAVREKN